VIKVHRYFKGKVLLPYSGTKSMPNKKEVNSTLLASCFLVGMFFMAALHHIQEDGQCCEDIKSNFLVAPPRKIILV
jgi:hypothetical protein